MPGPVPIWRYARISTIIYSMTLRRRVRASDATGGIARSNVPEEERVQDQIASIVFAPTHPSVQVHVEIHKVCAELGNSTPESGANSLDYTIII